MSLAISGSTITKTDADNTSSFLSAVSSFSGFTVSGNTVFSDGNYTLQVNGNLSLKNLDLTRIRIRLGTNAVLTCGEETSDLILQGNASISNGTYTKIILDSSYTPTQIDLVNTDITELENTTGNDIVINNTNTTITTKTETNGRFYAEIKDGILG